MQQAELKVYKKLARILDKIPNGYPTTKDGIHLRVLQWLFTPEEAAIACKLKLLGESPEKIAKRIKMPAAELEPKLESMYERGLIVRSISDKGKLFGLMPFVVGIYEQQILRLDKELALLMEEYVEKTKFKTIMTAKPTQFRIVPVQKTIKTELVIHPYQNAEQMIKNAKSWGMRDCICKKEKALLDEPCKIGDGGCLVFSKKEHNYDDSHLTTPITKEKALEVLRKAEEKGLVHCTMNIQSGQDYICNCCTCCCGILRAYSEFDVKEAFIKTNYIMHVNEEKCIGCGTCLERCQFGALELTSEIVKVNNKCIGCGVCAIVCPEKALHLVDRHPKELKKPPKTDTMWYVRRMLSRLKIPLRLLR